MPKTKIQEYEELTAYVCERGRKILERFGQEAVSEVTDSKFLAILEDVKAYWKDAYRPALTSLCCEAVGGQAEAAETVSLVLSLASAGIGIHDDIIDKSSHKNFRMTVLGKHGFEGALLVGDLLVLKAWMMFQEMLRKTGNPEKIAGIMEIYGGLSLEICETELMEFSCRRNLDIELEYYALILWRSMADTEACAKIGAMVGNGSENEVKALAEVGRRIGFNYRLRDDVKDTLNLEGNLPHRLRFETVPLPILYAANSSKERHAKIKSTIEKPRITPAGIKELLKICFESEAFAYVRAIAKENEKKAAVALRQVKPSSPRNLLAQMIEKSFTDVSELCL
jgi:geranylgeranyl diphosphate synthase type I